MEDKHFDKIFWFIVGLVTAVFLFDVAVIFVPVPDKGQKYADILTGSLNTGLLMSCVYYLLGGNPNEKKKADQVITGDNTSVENNTPITTT